MNGRKDRVEAIFQEAMDLSSPTEREAYLQRECGEDRDLRREVEELLRAAVEAEEVFETSLSRPALEQSGDRIGQYHLLQQIGEGGCGVVYMAEQEAPVRRKVALKIVKLGMDTRQVVARFEAERQALALMDHPNIAKVLDAGATATGRPYFVMELVRGRKITQYCDEQRFSTNQRLELFIQVCHAVQHAHQKGIIHRDLKPSNILVTERDEVPIPKVIDFGIAKATGGLQLTDKTLFTAFEQFIGTPAYMSPEQARLGEIDIDTRSDIYSLGVLLYELLTGRPPFDAAQFRRLAIEEVLKTIRETDPPVPSTRFTTMTAEERTTVAHSRHVEPSVLTKLVRGDLDWIVMKCLEKDRSRRYETASGLGVDIRRHLNNEPVIARPPSNVYRFRKLVRRNKIVFAFSSVASAALTIGLGAAVWQYIEKSKAESRALAAESKERSAHEVVQKIGSLAVARTLDEGLVAANSGDWLSASLTFSEDFVLDETLQGVAAQLDRQTHRLRINSYLRQSPQLEQMWFNRGDKFGGFDMAGQRILLGGTNAGYRLYSILSGQDLGPPVGRGCDHASLHPDGRRVVTGGGGGTNSLFTVWDASSGARVCDLREPGSDKPFRSDCSDLLFSPDGHWIAAALTTPGLEGRVMIWDVETGRCRRTIDYADRVGWVNGNEIRAFRFDDSGRRLVTTGTENRAVIWDCETGLPLYVLRGHRSWVYNACFGHEHTNWVVTCSFDRTACLWDLRNDQQPKLRVEHEDDGIQDVQFSPDDRMFVTGGLDSTVRLWDSETGRMLPPILRHHDRVLQAQWSPDAKHILTLTRDETVRFWHLDPEKPIVQTSTSDFSGDGRLELAHEGAAVWLKNSASSREVLAPRLLSSNVSALSFVGGRDDLFLAFSRVSGAAPAGASQIQLWKFAQKTPVGAPLGYDPSWSHLVSSPDGRRFAFFERDVEVPTASTNGVLVWEPASGSEPRRIGFFDEAVGCVAFDKTGRRMAVGSRSRATNRGILRLVDLEGSEKPAVLFRSTQWFGHVTFSGNGQWLAAACWDKDLNPGDALIWQVAEPGHSFGEPLRLRHIDGVLYVAFSDTGEMIATASEDHTTKVWCRTTNTWQLCVRPLPCGGEVYVCAFSHNGRWLATAHRTLESQRIFKWDSEIQIWDIKTGRPISVPFSFSEKTTRLEFVAGDTRLFVERSVPPALPKRWLIDLPVNDGSANEFVLRAELLSGERSFLKEGAGPEAREGPYLLIEQALLRVGQRNRLSKEECRELWLRLSGQ